MTCCSSSIPERRLTEALNSAQSLLKASQEGFVDNSAKSKTELATYNKVEQTLKKITGSKTPSSVSSANIKKLGTIEAIEEIITECDHLISDVKNHAAMHVIQSLTPGILQAINILDPMWSPGEPSSTKQQTSKDEEKNSNSDKLKTRYLKQAKEELNYFLQKDGSINKKQLKILIQTFRPSEALTSYAVKIRENILVKFNLVEAVLKQAQQLHSYIHRFEGSLDKPAQKLLKKIEEALNGTRKNPQTPPSFDLVASLHFSILKDKEVELDDLSRRTLYKLMGLNVDNARTEKKQKKSPQVKLSLLFEEPADEHLPGSIPDADHTKDLSLTTYQITTKNVESKYFVPPSPRSKTKSKTESTSPSLPTSLNLVPTEPSYSSEVMALLNSDALTSQRDLHGKITLLLEELYRKQSNKFDINLSEKIESLEVFSQWILFNSDDLVSRCSDRISFTASISAEPLKENPITLKYGCAVLANYLLTCSLVPPSIKSKTSKSNTSITEVKSNSRIMDSTPRVETKRGTTINTENQWNLLNHLAKEADVSIAEGSVEKTTEVDFEEALVDSLRLRAQEGIQEYNEYLRKNSRGEFVHENDISILSIERIVKFLIGTNYRHPDTKGIELRTYLRDFCKGIEKDVKSQLLNLKRPLLISKMKENSAKKTAASDKETEEIDARIGLLQVEINKLDAELEALTYQNILTKHLLDIAQEKVKKIEMFAPSNLIQAKSIIEEKKDQPHESKTRENKNLCLENYVFVYSVLPQIDFLDVKLVLSDKTAAPLMNVMDAISDAAAGD